VIWWEPAEVADSNAAAFRNSQASSTDAVPACDSYS